MNNSDLVTITLTTYCNAATQMNRTPEIGPLMMAEILRVVADTLEEEAEASARIALLIAKLGEYREPLN